MTEMKRVYYLGGFPQGAIIQSKQVGFALPPVGGFLEVEDFRAKDLANRNKRYFTFDPKIAAMAARGEDYEHYEDAQVATGNLTIEDLQRLLAEKLAEAQLDAQVDVQIKQELQPETSLSETPEPENPVVTQTAVPRKSKHNKKEDD